MYTSNKGLFSLFIYLFKDIQWLMDCLRWNIGFYFYFYFYFYFIIFLCGDYKVGR